MKHKTDTIPAVVMAADGCNPLGIARSLRRSGVPVYLLAGDHAVIVRKSRFIKDGVFNVRFSDPPELKAGLEKILQQIGQPQVRPVLFVTNETHYHRLMLILDFVKEHFIELTPIASAVPFAEKEQQFPLAEQAGFRIPKTLILKTKEDIAQVSALQFPVIVKPQAIHTQGGYTGKADIFDHFAALKTTVAPAFQHPATILLVQEFVPGGDKQILFFMASCEKNGEVRAWFTGRKWRQYPPNRGVMTAGCLEYLPELEKRAKALCKLFGLRGFIGIECKQHAETKDLFYIESSLRVEAYNSICRSAGRELVLDAYRAALGLPCEAVKTGSMTGSWCDFFTDLDAARILIRNKNLTWRQFFIRLPRPIQFAVFAWDDPMPFLYWLRQRIISVCKKICRRK